MARLEMRCLKSNILDASVSNAVTHDCFDPQYLSDMTE